MDIEVKQAILDRLKGIRHFHRSSMDQYAMRCPICGDSKKDPNKTRFYLLINTTNENPILYCCHNCNESGILKPDILRLLEINDLAINSRLIRFNKESVTSIRRRLGVGNKKLNISVPKPIYTRRNELKKKYIEDRLGVEFNFNELVNMKCIFSLEEFVKVNNIEKLTVTENRAITLNNDYVGFLTCNNEFINFRDITNKNKLRYDKYTIVPNLDDTTKMYMIPNKIDILTTEKVTINIAEGVFDVLGIYYHIMNKKTDNTIYCAVCGSGFMNVIKYFIRMGLVGKNIHINIFSDNDHDLYFYNKLVKYARMWFGNISIYYNTKEKDFGVPKSKINLVKRL